MVERILGSRRIPLELRIFGTSCFVRHTSQVRPSMSPNPLLKDHPTHGLGAAAPPLSERFRAAPGLVSHRRKPFVLPAWKHPFRDLGRTPWFSKTRSQLAPPEGYEVTVSYFGSVAFAPFGPFARRPLKEF